MSGTVTLFCRRKSPQGRHSSLEPCGADLPNCFWTVGKLRKPQEIQIPAFQLLVYLLVTVEIWRKQVVTLNPMFYPMNNFVWCSICSYKCVYHPLTSSIPLFHSQQIIASAQLVLWAECETTDTSALVSMRYRKDDVLPVQV
ncbi:hypothetical protein CEXT_175181 [Caerostris extrusa]|uniref:Uncharacterized protein n=1 Tax=Caerostris extrusa TaxID=172846 RepID=A0AAV4XLC1_CAEEX|nr:hypothetical protein CEXT_175181 [Caerostris extrusa]